MTDKEILVTLQQVFDDVFIEPVEVSPALSAEEVEEWDSLTHVSLVVAVEKTFKIRFAVGEVEAAANIGDMVGLIKQHLQE